MYRRLRVERPGSYPTVRYRATMVSDAAQRRAALYPGAYAKVKDTVRALIDVIELPPSGVGDSDLTGVGFISPAQPPTEELRAALAALDSLEVVQVRSAGIDWIAPLLPADVMLCSARGARDGPVAEWILGALLGTTSGLLKWAGATSWVSGLGVEDLSSWTVLIVGMGSIGRTVKKYLAPIGANVIGVASRARPGVVHGVEELPQLLPLADAVVLLTPLTDSTEHLLGAAELAGLKGGALLVNAARGQVVDTDALVAELQRGRIRAVLDVTDPEPLPDGHPLWTAPGVLSITPHVAGASAQANAAADQLVADQLERWARGEPLINVVRPGSKITSQG